jgi:hypothetical protein
MALIPRAPLITPPQSRSTQQPQRFPNNAGLYTTAAVLAVGTALMAQVPAALRSQAPQPFQNPGRLYTPIPFGKVVSAQAPTVQPSAQTWSFSRFDPPAASYAPAASQIGAQVERTRFTFEGFIQPAPQGLYTTSATAPPLGKALFDVSMPAPRVQAPQPFPSTSGLYTTSAYVPAAGQIGSQVVFTPRQAQTDVGRALVYYTSAYNWPAAVVTAQPTPIACAQRASVTGASLSLYSATYTPPPAARFDAQPRASVQPQGFAQSAQIGLYQPQIYQPPQAPRFDDPRRLPYSFAYQGRVQSSPLGLYSTAFVILPISGQTPSLSGAGEITVSGPGDATVNGSGDVTVFG